MVIEDTVLISVALSRVTTERLTSEVNNLWTRETDIQTQSDRRTRSTIRANNKVFSEITVSKNMTKLKETMHPSVGESETSSDGELFRTAGDIEDEELKEELSLLQQAKAETKQFVANRRCCQC